MIVDNEIIEQRRLICEDCPLCAFDKDDKEYVCSEDRAFNPETQTLITLNVDSFPEESYKSGCGCYINELIKQTRYHCVLNRWEK